MDQPILIVVHEEGATPTGAVFDAWPVEHRPKIQLASIIDLLDHRESIDGMAAAWVVVENTPPSDLFELLAELQERRVPTMLTRSNETQYRGTIDEDGLIVCPPGTDPKVTVAMLQGLLSQASMIRAMRAEFALLQAHHGGLCAQIDKIDQELRLAAQLQREFLPHELVDLGEVEFHVLWRPAGYVSGDIYDVVRLDEQHIGFFIADAVGHGVPAALLTMVIKRCLHTKAIDTEDPRGYRIIEPAEAMGRLNKEMIEHQLSKVRFASACYGVVNCLQRRVCIARAGHPYPLLLRADGQTETVEPDGGLLGVFEEEQFEQLEVQLEPGDRLLLYSDGFELAFPGDRDQAQARRAVASTQYEQEFESLRTGPLDEALRRLEQRLDIQAGSLNQRDDLTVLCLSAMSHSTPEATTCPFEVVAAH